MSEVPHALIAFAVAWSVLLLLLTAVAFLVLLRMRVIEKGATSSSDLESNRECQALKALDNNLTLTSEFYVYLAHAVISVLLFLFIVFILTL